MKILIADLFSASHIESLKSLGFEILYNDKLNGESLKKALQEFQPTILVVRSTKVQADHFEATKSLEAVIRAGSGYDTIDKDSANKKGVFVANCPGKNAVAVTELAWGLILSIDRRIPENDLLLKQKQWNKDEFSKARGLKGRTLGIIGYGNIGAEMAQRALGFDLNVIVKSNSRPNPKDSRVKVTESLDELLAVSDIISIHVPATASTKNLVNKEFLQKMKKDAVLINTSRGNLVNEKDLLAHLQENKEFWCGLDVYLDEPTEKKCAFDKELAQFPRVVGTHHIGASTKEAEDAIGQEAYRMILEYKKTGVMPNCVNMNNSNGLKSVFIKYGNNSKLLDEIFCVLAKQEVKVLEVKIDSFEGGLTSLGKIWVKDVKDEIGLVKCLGEIQGVVEARIA